MDMNLTFLAIALSPTTIMVAFIIFGLRSIRNDLNTGLARLDSRMDRLDSRMDRLDSRMDRFEKRMDRFGKRMDRFEKRMSGSDEKIEHDRETNRRSFEKLFGMLGELSERVARIEGYVSALSFFTGAEPLSNVPHSRTRPDDQALSA